MRAVRIHDHGGPETLRVDEVPEPGPPGPGELTVRVRAVALNHMDLWVRRGLPGIEQRLPFTMSCDAAGEVLETGAGAGAERFAPGDRVVLTPMLWCGRCEGCLAGEQSLCRSFRMRGEHEDGFAAEKVVVRAEAARKLAPAVGFEEAAAFCLTHLTAYRMLVSRARLRPGEDVLVAGLGGVSLAALAIARMLGCRVFVTSSSKEKLERALALGAEAGSDSTERDVAREVLGLTGRKGVGLVVDSAAGPVWNAAIKALSPGGRLVCCGATAGLPERVDATRLFWKQVSLIGSTMGSLRELTEVVGLLNGGHLRPVIDSTHRFDEVRRAHERLESGLHFGKVVLVP